MKRYESSETAMRLLHRTHWLELPVTGALPSMSWV